MLLLIQWPWSVKVQSAVCETRDAGSYCVIQLTKTVTVDTTLDVTTDSGAKMLVTFRKGTASVGVADMRRIKSIAFNKKVQPVIYK
jgi:hypothetical protein